VNGPPTQTTRVLSRGNETVRVVRTCRVDVVAGPDAGRRERLERPLFRIGTHPSNDLVLTDSTVSKHHVEIAVASEGYRITDLDSSNGTLIGSARLGELTVLDPITLHLGTTVLEVVPTDDEAEIPASARAQFGAVLGRSVIMRELFEQLEAVADSDASLLLEGETGVGKEQIAQAVHRQSARARGPFVVVDCGAVVGELMEAELFGYVRGAFSGADRARQGLLESANGGTLFLDEVGELPPALQAKLLGVLERRRVVPIGSNTGRAIDVRVIAATNKNLAREVNQGRFRADLFYRLAVVRLPVPPLRERKEDIPQLVQGFLDQLRVRYGERIPPSLSAVALSKMGAHDWPGNVRELRNAVERAALKIQEAHDAASADSTATDDATERGESGEPMVADAFFTRRAESVEAFERDYFTALLARAQSNLSQVARLAGLDRRYLHRILRRLGLYRAATNDPE
jgi:transcriptional regulator with GAF, ATPase, and Fis domain